MVAPGSENQAGTTNIVLPASTLQEKKPLAASPSPRGLKRRASETLAEAQEAPEESGNGGALEAEVSPPKRRRVTEWLTGLVQAARACLSSPRAAFSPKPLMPAENEKIVASDEVPAPKEDSLAAASSQLAATQGDDDTAHLLGSTWPASAEEEREASAQGCTVEEMKEQEEQFNAKVAAEENEDDEEEADRWVIVDKDEVDVFKAVDSEEIIGVLQKGQLVEVAGPASIVDDYEMIPIKPTGALQADFVRWRISEAVNGDFPVWQAAAEQEQSSPVGDDAYDCHVEVAAEDSWQWHMQEAVALGDEVVADFLSSSLSAAEEE